MAAAAGTVAPDPLLVDASEIAVSPRCEQVGCRRVVCVNWRYVYGHWCASLDDVQRVKQERVDVLARGRLVRAKNRLASCP